MPGVREPNNEDEMDRFCSSAHVTLWWIAGGLRHQEGTWWISGGLRPHEGTSADKEIKIELIEASPFEDSLTPNWKRAREETAC